MAYCLEEAVAKYSLPNIPAWGPHEEVIDPPMKQIEPDKKFYPGEGLSRHDMLYVGEGCNRIFLIRGGKIIWKYDTGAGWELDDIWMLSNGNILFTHMYWAAEITPQKEMIWYMRAPENTEIHSIQPIGQNKIIMALNENPAPRLLEIDKQGGRILSDRVMPYWGESGAHPQTRRFRVTKDQTILMCYLTGRQVVEFDMDLNVIWRVSVEKPWAAVRLRNGNTLVSDESDESVWEFAPDGSAVWHLKQEDLGEYRVTGLQSCLRLDNGNTILCARGGDGKTAQLVEVTQEKEVVWVLKDWMNLGPCTSVQILKDGGIPEEPGQCQR